MKLSTLRTLAISLTLALEANAVVVSLVGDKDGFGLPGAPAVPADGTLWRDTLGGVFFTDYRSAFDLANAPFTDIWSTASTVSYTHAYSLGSLAPTSATLAIQFAGVADSRGPWNVEVNNVVIGQVPTNLSVNAFQEVQLLSFTVPTALLSGSDSMLITLGGGDGFAINFSELTIDTATGGVPDTGATASLLGLALLGLVAVRRRLS